MSHKTVVCLELLEVAVRRVLLQDVLPNWLPRAAVGQGELADSERARQRAEEVAVLFCECLLGPRRDVARVFVESRERDVAQGCQVVIPDQADHLRQRADQLDTLVRVRPIAYQVAEAPHGVAVGVLAGISRHVMQNGFEGSRIGVNIGDDQDAHVQHGSTAAAGLEELVTPSCVTYNAHYPCPSWTIAA